MELVAHCTACDKPLYCRDGFFDGVLRDGATLCHSCAGQTGSEEDPGGEDKDA